MFDIVRCADGSYYDRQHARHASAAYRATFRRHIFSRYAFYRRPVTLLYHQEFDRITDAIAVKRQTERLEPA